MPKTPKQPAVAEHINSTQRILEVLCVDNGVSGRRVFLECNLHEQWELVEHLWWSWGGKEVRALLANADGKFSLGTVKSANKKLESS